MTAVLELSWEGWVSRVATLKSLGWKRACFNEFAQHGGWCRKATFACSGPGSIMCECGAAGTPR